MTLQLRGDLSRVRAVCDLRDYYVCCRSTTITTTLQIVVLRIAPKMRLSFAIFVVLFVGYVSAHPFLNVARRDSPVLKVKDVVCPDGQSECPDNNTCCKLSSGQWGCCPLPSAVCCSDGEHCCPTGYKCDPPYCEKGGERIPMLEKQPSLKQQCPSGTCSSGQTCCMLSSGQWGCCPLPSAVCCSDGEHCCPTGYTCDPPYCEKGGERIPMLEKQPSLKQQCPSGTCSSGQTCCMLSSGQWGCCPLPSAVCCSDGEHCCPTGYTCDPPYCEKGGERIPMLEKQPSLKQQCPSGTCSSGQTCCMLSSGQWGCCPLPVRKEGKESPCACPSGTCSSGQVLAAATENTAAQRGTLAHPPYC